MLGWSDNTFRGTNGSGEKSPARSAFDRWVSKLFACLFVTSHQGSSHENENERKN